MSDEKTNVTKVTHIDSPRPPAANDPDTLRVIDLVCRLEEKHNRGESATPEEVCGESPELLERVRKRWEQLQIANKALGFKTMLGVDVATTIRPTAVPGYEIVRLLGEGGNGQVFLARSVALKREVALKTIRGDGFARAIQRDRFRVEAEAVARLQHPNIVQIFESGEHEGLPYIAMEYCPKGSLAAHVKDRTLPAREAATVVAILARAVASAHAANIVHRDLKPENVLLAADGSPKITDFGLAKLLDEDQHLTRSEAVLGTPSYMSPEQASGEMRLVGPLCDVWALGAVLYRLLSGRVPFPGNNVHETFRLLREEEPLAPSRIVVGMPRDLEVICLKCLRKEPAGRYASAAELADDLGRYLENKPIVARSIGRVERTIKWMKRNPIAAALASAVVALLISGSALVYAKYLDAHEQKQIADGKALDAAREAKRADGLTDEAKTQARAATENANRLAEQLTESRRLLDLNRLREANAAFDNRLVQTARDSLNEVSPENRCMVWGILNRRLEAGLFTLYGHSDCVHGVAFSGDGMRIATASFDNTARIWDARTGQCLHELVGHTGSLTCIAYSGDGSRVVTGSFDKTARVWDAQSGKLLFELTAHVSTVWGVAISDDGSRIVTGSADKTARIWDGNTGNSLFDLEKHTESVWSVAITRDGSRAITGSTDETANVWDARTGRHQLELKGHTGSIHGVAITADGKRIVTASWDKTARVWDSRTGKVLHRLEGHANYVDCIAISADGSRIATGSSAQTRIWDGYSGKELFELNGHTGYLCAVAISDDGTRIATAGWDRTARIWNARSSASLPELRLDSVRMGSVAVSHDASRIVTGSDDMIARIWDSRSGICLTELRGHRASISAVAISADGSRVATSAFDHSIRIWDGRDGVSLLEIRRHTGPVTALAISGDGRRVVSGSADRTAWLWNAETGKAICQLRGHTGWVSGAAISNDGSRIATACEDKTARVFDASTGECLLELKRPHDGVRGVAINADGSRVVTACWNTAARLWDTRTGKHLMEFKRHTRDVNAAAITDDGSRVITGSEDATMRIWDAQTGQSILELKGFGSPVVGVGMSGDGSLLAATTMESTVRTWNSQFARDLLEFKGHLDSVNALAVSADGRSLLSCSDDDARLWDTETGHCRIEVTGHEFPIKTVAFSKDGSRLISSDRSKKTIVWNAASGARIETDALPAIAPLSNQSPDGKFMYIPFHDRIVRMPTEVGLEQRLRHLWLTRPDPSWHVDRQAECAKHDNAYGVVLHRYLEQRARAILEHERGNGVSAFFHLAAAALLKPPPRGALENVQ